MDHDPLCPCGGPGTECQGIDSTCIYCKCEEYRAVRSDERERIAQRIRTSTPNRRMDMYDDYRIGFNAGRINTIREIRNSDNERNQP